jgi:phosphoribosylglycinamide formyltransferase 2
LPIPEIGLRGASASAVVLADRDAEDFTITGLADALALATPNVHVDARIFGKPVTRPFRRMAVALAQVADASDTDAARAVAVAAAARIIITYG